ncbi:hypothetical protein K505DRAFT_93788 [Melanomma pulvis-pyrius CBS 109.77]|uniref:Uncharacterized protein n=1 Tax=Melanomma pulvis-pyrius CBS 109.77 TaxID=1314802 RepID=A0A6A6XX75_9PLEO|nr:hypothetical protein K505DRAFT_93788 [Melanomma pulvis-pyrius CBS 109.77]
MKLQSILDKNIHTNTNLVPQIPKLNTFPMQPKHQDHTPIPSPRTKNRYETRGVGTTVPHRRDATPLPLHRPPPPPSRTPSPTSPVSSLQLHPPSSTPVRDLERRERGRGDTEGDVASRRRTAPDPSIPRPRAKAIDQATGQPWGAPAPSSSHPFARADWPPARPWTASRRRRRSSRVRARGRIQRLKENADACCMRVACEGGEGGTYIATVYPEASMGSNSGGGAHGARRWGSPVFGPAGCACSVRSTMLMRPRGGRDGGVAGFWSLGREGWVRGWSCGF